jgi:hypothetical protein
MKKDLRVSYKNFWPGFDRTRMPQDYFFDFVLSHRYNIVNDDVNPDVIFYSVFGANHPDVRSYKKKPLMVGISGEPFPITGNHDFVIGYGYGNQNSFRLPLWVMFIIWDKHTLDTEYKILNNPNIGQGCHHTPGYFVAGDNGGKNNPLHITNLLKRHLTVKPKTKFCNFTYTNPVDSRIDFFIRLSRYKQVDSTGTVLNNTGYRMVSKSRELSDYKFTIAFENSLLPGYVTEKIFDPLAAGSVPLYLGDDFVKSDFNPKAFINVRDFKNFSEALRYVEEVDKNEELYNSYLTQPIFENADSVLSYPEKVFNKLYSELIKERPELA